MGKRAVADPHAIRRAAASSLAGRPGIERRSVLRGLLAIPHENAFACVLSRKQRDVDWLGQERRVQPRRDVGFAGRLRALVPGRAKFAAGVGQHPVISALVVGLKGGLDAAGERGIQRSGRQAYASNATDALQSGSQW